MTKTIDKRGLSVQQILRCPHSGLPINEGTSGWRARERQYPMVDGILDLVIPERVAAIDAHFQEQYGADTAKKYDSLLRLLSLVIGCRESAQRRRLVKLLNPPLGGRVLEVAVGTGANLPHLAKAVGPGGEILGVDLSLAMLKVAEKRPRSLATPIHLFRADGCFLPFADNSFDAVFHFGGINMFGDVKRSIGEMVRVAKPGAPVLIGDEGMSESRRNTWIGRRLGKMNSLNLCRPPFATLPWVEIKEFRLYWAWREIFYVLVFRRGAAAPATQNASIREEINKRLE